jgi:hypothetical protein
MRFETQISGIKLVTLFQSWASIEHDISITWLEVYQWNLILFHITKGLVFQRTENNTITKLFA